MMMKGMKKSKGREVKEENFFLKKFFDKLNPKAINVIL